jgi:hypothetical protein
VVEWYEEAYYQRRTDMIDLIYLRDNFEIKEILYAGVDGAICKAVLLCKTEGIVPKERLGISI